MALGSQYRNIYRVDLSSPAEQMRGLVTVATVMALAGGGGLKDVTTSSPEQDVMSGRIIYSTICVRCHGIDGKGAGQMNVCTAGPRSDLPGGAK